MPHPILSQALSPGTKLGSFVIQETVGANRHAYTYLAYDRSLAREVIVKENFPAGLSKRIPETNEVVAKSPDFEEFYEIQKSKFLNQGQKMAAIDCPGVVITYGVYEALGTAYAVVAKINGISLEKETERRYAINQVWEPREIKLLLNSLLGSLNCLHSKKTFHKDIRPSHIWLNKSMEPILVGFDFSGPDMREKKGNVIISTECTPPEKLLNKDINDAAADIYSLAATFHKLLLGSYPKRGDIRYYSLRGKRLADNEILLESYSKTFLSGIDKALEPQLEYRFRTVEEWISYISSSVPEKSAEEEEPKDHPIMIDTGLLISVSENDTSDLSNDSPRSRRRGKGMKSFLKKLFSKEEKTEE